jgi:hypothetical protein
MFLESKSDLVEFTGAEENDILIGAKRLNKDLRIKIYLRQEKGDKLQIKGSFDLINAGTGTYASAMQEFEGRQFEKAKDLIRLVKQKPGGKKCTYILHKDLLRVEEPTQPSREKIINILRKAGKYGRSVGESEQHKRLKTIIANSPDLVGIDGAEYEPELEYEFPSMDNIDIMFKGPKQWVGIEVKSEISPTEDILRGLFQCIKYRVLTEAYLSVLDETKDVRIILALGGTFPQELSAIRDILGIEVLDKITA